MHFDDVMARNGGVACRRQLLACGETDDSIRQARDTGFLEHLRFAWYATKDADPRVVAAVRDGGVYSCCAALEWHGLWVPEGARTHQHSRVTRHERRLTHNRCLRYGRPTAADAAIDDVATALQYAARCLDPEGFIVVCDSALHQGKITFAQLRADFADAPLRVQAAIEQCDKRSGSGTESLMRTRLRSEGVKVVVQHHVPGVRWVDLLVGDVLAVEVDSVEYHTKTTDYESDRKVDRQLLVRGYIPLHVTYRQVVHEWDETYTDIRAILAAGLHRAPRIGPKFHP